ncbi:MAG: acetate--CoA ligase family protein [Chitinispirillia bacterium]|jgi:acetyltransferase
MLDKLFYPKTVAVIGASSKELSIGNRIVKNLIDYGYKGEIYPVNPKADYICDRKAYPSIFDISGDIDLVHIVIPNKFVPMAVNDCGKKDVKFVIVNSAGFKEIGREGEKLEIEMLENAKKYNVRIFGPNCQGIINSDPKSKAYCNFTFTKPSEGYISIVAQSGGVGEIINQRFSELGIGIRMYASNGNACDISIPEVIEYWANDEKTRVIVIYLESMSDKKQLFQTLKKTSVIKPILAMKAGRTKEGAKAASSHTGSLSKQEITTELLFKKAGVLSFRDEEELCQAAVAFTTQPIPRGRRVGILTNTGGPAVIATDTLVDGGLKLPHLSEITRSKLKKSLHPAASIHNPIDVLATADAKQFRVAINTLMEEKSIDSILINFVTPFFVDTERIAKEIAEVSLLKRKPVICNLMTDKRKWTATMRILIESGVPVYSFPVKASRALIALNRYNDLQKHKVNQPVFFKDVDKYKVKGILNTAKKSGRILLNYDEANLLLSSYKIPVVKWRIAESAEESRKAAQEIGYPVVLKIDSASVIHKSDRGGVSLNIKDSDAIDHEVKRMQEKFNINCSSDMKFCIQQYLKGGSEIILGAKEEKGLGHIIIFGSGGIYSEVYRDVAFGISPVSGSEAEAMVKSVKIYPILSGIRGQKGVDLQGLITIIQRVSQLVTDFPEIREMDLNPVMAYKDKIFTVDARIKIN